MVFLYIVCFFDYLEVVYAFFEFGVDTELRVEKIIVKEILFYIVVGYGNGQMVRAFLEKGVDLNSIVFNYLKIFLYVVVSDGYVQVVKYLL